MKKFETKQIVEKACQTLEELSNSLNSLPSLKLSDLDSESTVLVIVDMVNGFAKTGALSSPRVGGIIDKLSALANACEKKGIKKLCFLDTHTNESIELDSYPEHCMEGSYEAELVEELKYDSNILIPKNSTNGFLEPAFSEFLELNPSVDNYIITGDCTDICILQFATTIKAWFNNQNLKKRIIIPVELCETFDGGTHDAELLNIVSFSIMQGNGMELVSEIEI